MTKRIVSGIFILTALGALGVILAGALTSGEQLIVRFLTAVIVAALGLYVISDLRLQADEDAAGPRLGHRPRLAGIDVPPNSTAAFMATVTGKGDTPVEIESIDTIIQGDTIIQDDGAENDQADPRQQPDEQGVGATSSSTSEAQAAAVVEDVGSPDGAPVPSVLGPAPVTVRAADLPDLTGSRAATITNLFARRTSESSADETDWPSVGGGIGFERDHSEDADLDLNTDLSDTDLSDTYISHTEIDVVAGPPSITIEGDHGETDLSPVSESHVSESGGSQGDEALSDEPIVVTDFEYSGDLEAPEFQWPAPTEAADEAEISETPEHQAVTVDASIEVQDDSIDEAAPEADPDFATNEVSSKPITAEADGDLLTAAINGVERPLPSPFLDRSEINAAEYADAPLAPIIDLRDVAGVGGPEVEDAISSGEIEVVSALIEQGMLSTEGPISDRDVRTMVYVAFTSNELRKLLLAGGAPEGPNPGLDLGPVELFSGDRVQPSKTTMYINGPAVPAIPAEAQSQLG